MFSNDENQSETVASSSEYGCDVRAFPHEISDELCDSIYIYYRYYVKLSIRSLLFSFLFSWCICMVSGSSSPSCETKICVIFLFAKLFCYFCK